MGAYGIYKLINGELRWKKVTSILLMSIASIIGLTISALPFLDKYKQKIIDANIVKDKFGLENLKATVQWTGFEWLIGALLIVGVGVMLVLINRGKTKWGIVGIFIISLLTVNLSSVVIAPRIEQYSQAAAIEFYKSLQSKDCYVETYGFKSYAHFFYSDKQLQSNSNSYNSDWLLKGDIDKPAYFVSKITTREEINEKYPELKELYRKNGFVFWLRMPKK